MEFTYNIDGKKFIQKPLVLGQLRQLLSILKTVEIPGDANAVGLIDAFGDRLQEVLAVILTEEGTSLKDKNIAAVSEMLSFCMTPETALQAIEDFFTCNPVSSLLERLTGAMGKVAANLPSIGSAKLSSSFAEETLLDGTRSSGATD